MSCPLAVPKHRLWQGHPAYRGDQRGDRGTRLEEILYTLKTTKTDEKSMLNGVTQDAAKQEDRIKLGQP